jgi:hypothetical protein
MALTKAKKALLNETFVETTGNQTIAGNKTFTGTVSLGNSLLVRGTPIVTTSGANIDFTGIPDWVRRITLSFSGVSTTGTSPPMIQIGSGSITTTGYSNSNCIVATGVVTTSFTTGFGLGVNTANWAGTNLFSGNIVLVNISGNIWVCTGIIANAGSALWFTSGSVTLSGILDRLRLTTLGGVETFDAGLANALYE